MTQLPKPSGAEDGVNSPIGCPAKKFRYSSHSEPAATRRRAWRYRGRRSPGAEKTAAARLSGVRRFPGVGRKSSFTSGDRAGAQPMETGMDLGLKDRVAIVT